MRPLALLVPILLGCSADDAARTAAPPASIATAANSAASSSMPPPQRVATAAPSASATAAAAEPDVPLGPPPSFTQTCGAPPGKALPIKLVRSGLDPWPGSGVFTSAAQIRKLGQTPPPSVDFTRERLVHWVVRQNPSARVASVVETAQEIVIGTDAPVYCGGAAPPDTSLELVIPASAKPVRIDVCRRGECTGPPRP